MANYNNFNGRDGRGSQSNTQRPSNNTWGGGREFTSAADREWSSLKQKFNINWIKEGATAELVTFAEEAGKFMAEKKLTNSKIRSIYGEIKRIQMGEFEKEKSSFYLLRPKVAYALGRDEKNEGLKLFKLVFDHSAVSVTDQKSYQNFCNLIEAILAYHKAYGGKD